MVGIDTSSVSDPMSRGQSLSTRQNILIHSAETSMHTYYAIVWMYDCLVRLRTPQSEGLARCSWYDSSDGDAKF